VAGRVRFRVHSPAGPWQNEPAKVAKADMDEPTQKLRTMHRKGIYLLPNLLTTGGLFAGFYGIVGAIDGNYQRSAVALFIAMLLDGMDGRLARLTGTESAFGKEYDSLADLVSFGIAPAIIVYQWGLVRLGEYGWIWGKLGWLAAFLYAVSAALRLARFNVADRSGDRRFFEGLPSPSAAALVVFMVWLGTELEWSGGFTLLLATLVTAVAGALMVSHVPYYSFKEVSPKGRISFTYVIAVPLTFVLVALNPSVVLFCMAVTYAASGPMLVLWRIRRRRRNPVGSSKADAGGT
jgi:CDP-diacylglycerol--serine O-phosphatidyltransferase